MLFRLFLTALLEGVRLAPAMLRRPVPVIWYDQMRETRARRNLARIAGDLSRYAAPPPPVPWGTAARIPFRGSDVDTRAGSPGWTAAIFVESI